MTSVVERLRALLVNADAGLKRDDANNVIAPSALGGYEIVARFASRTKSKAINQVNAELHVAAVNALPALIDAVEAAESVVHADDHGSDPWWAMNELRKALAKLRVNENGESQSVPNDHGGK